MIKDLSLLGIKIDRMCFTSILREKGVGRQYGTNFLWVHSSCSCIALSIRLIPIPCHLLPTYGFHVRSMSAFSLDTQTQSLWKHTTSVGVFGTLERFMTNPSLPTAYMKSDLLLYSDLLRYHYQYQHLKGFTITVGSLLQLCRYIISPQVIDAIHLFLI